MEQNRTRLAPRTRRAAGDSRSPLAGPHVWLHIIIPSYHVTYHRPRTAETSKSCVRGMHATTLIKPPKRGVSRPAQAVLVAKVARPGGARRKRGRFPPATMSTNARRRLMRDFKRMQNDPPEGVNGAPQDNDIMKWHAVIFGYVTFLSAALVFRKPAVLGNKIPADDPHPAIPTRNVPYGVCFPGLRTLRGRTEPSSFTWSSRRSTRTRHPPSSSLPRCSTPTSMLTVPFASTSCRINGPRSTTYLPF